MQIETTGNYQIHMIAHEDHAAGWDAYITVMQFDEALGDFRCVLERHKVTDHAFVSYEQAIEAARHAGNAFMAGKLRLR